MDPGEPADAAALAAAVAQFKLIAKRPPNDWQEMIDAKLLTRVPVGKNGRPMNFSDYIQFSEFRPRQIGKPQ